MELVYDLLLVAHLLGMAAVVGVWLAVAREPRWLPGMLHGALTQLVTGIAMVGIAESGALDADVDHAKIGVKLVVALGVAGVVMVGRNRGGPARLVHVAGGLAVLNVVVAVLW